jgi:glycosyltransferase involved in cell wall biosynthesis
MQIAMIGFRGIPHTYGGNEEVVRHVAPRLAARGHEIIVYCRSGYFPKREPYWKGVRRIFYPAPEHKSLGQFMHAAEAMLDAAVRRPDIVYVHTLPSAPFTLLPALLRQRVVVNVNGMEWGRDKWGPIGKGYFRAAARISLMTATAIVNDSEAMRQFYRQRFGRDSYFIAYGAEIEESTNPELIAPYSIEPQGYYLIASRLVPENNADLIIDAYLASSAMRPLIVAGGANYKSPWVEKVLSKAGDRVRFIGHVGTAEAVRELHCGCYAYIHGHSLGGTNPSLLKALGYGNCIMALDNPFNREVLTGRDKSSYGILFPKDAAALSTAIDAIDKDPELAARYRAKAPNRIREAYTWDFITDEYEKMFRAVAAARPGDRLP